MEAQLRGAESRASELQQSLKSATLEQSYEKVLLEIQKTYEEDRSRVLRVRIQLLEDENDALQDQLDESDKNVETLERVEIELRDQLDETDIEMQRIQKELRIKAREAETLKAEVNSLNNVNSDSTKLLTEKLALSRELANLKPELEHLRSQAASNQSAISEKLSLQRQLSSLQVELETERRTVERTKSKDLKRDETDSKLKSLVNDLRKELAKEKAERQKMDKQNTKEAVEREAQRAKLESKLEAFRTKLRTTKEQLKETQDELSKAQAAVAERRATSVDNPRKRSIARFDPDATIGTPGDLHDVKRNKRASTALPGDKSAFSITPFLNRTLNVAPDSPVAASEADAGSDRDDGQNMKIPNKIVATENTQQDPPFPLLSRGNVKSQPKKTAPLKSSSQKGNSQTKSKKTSSMSVLEKVAEEGNEENYNTEQLTEQLTGPVLKQKGNTEATEPQKAPPKKKHKLLGSNRERTLFDDDDAEVPKGKNIPRNLNSLGGKSLAIARGSLRVGLGPAEFSPLKRDRKSGGS